MKGKTYLFEYVDLQHVLDPFFRHVPRPEIIFFFLFWAAWDIFVYAKYWYRVTLNSEASAEW